MHVSRRDNIHLTGHSSYTKTVTYIDHNSNFQLLTEKIQKLNRILTEGQMDAYRKSYSPRLKSFFYQEIIKK